MSYFRTGDVVFRPTGEPAVFTGQKSGDGRILLDTDKTALKQDIRHGYLNGMSPEDRERFNSIMDDVGIEKEPEKRVADLQAKVDALKEEPKKNFHLARYLNAEIAHIMNTYELKPRFYNAEEYKVR